MRRNYLLPFILTVTLIVVFSCKEENYVTSPDQTIYGSWVRNVTEDSGNIFTAELRINGDNTYDFILVSDAPGHTNSRAEFSIVNGRMNIVDDADCGGVGIYDYVVGESSLALVAADDQCDARKSVIQGVWNKK